MKMMYKIQCQKPSERQIKQQCQKPSERQIERQIKQQCQKPIERQIKQQCQITKWKTNWTVMKKTTFETTVDYRNDLTTFPK